MKRFLLMLLLVANYGCSAAKESASGGVPEHNPLVKRLPCATVAYAGAVFNPVEGGVEFDLLPTASWRSVSPWQTVFRVISPEKSAHRELFTILSDDNLDLHCKANTPGGSFSVSVKDFTMEPGKPVRIAVGWGNGSVELYIDGKLAAQTAFAGTIAPIPPFWLITRGAPFGAQAAVVRRGKLTAENLTPPDQKLAPGGENVFYLDNISGQMSLNEEQLSSVTMLNSSNQSQDFIFRDGDKVQLRFIGCNYDWPAATAVSLNGERVDARFSGLGKGVAEGFVDLGQLPPGFYKWQVALPDGADFAGTLSVLAAEPRPGKLYDWMGHHGLFDPELMKKCGFHIERVWDTPGQFTWDVVQPEPGKFNWDDSDRMLEAALANGQQPVAVIANSPYWAALEPPDEVKNSHPNAKYFMAWQPRDKEQFRSYVRALGERYRGRIRYYEIYNEVDYHPPFSAVYFSGTTQDYFELLKIAHEELKAIDPQNQILISGFGLVSTSDRDMPSKLLEMGATNYCDIWSIHAYSGTVGLKERQAELARYAPDMPYYQTEQAWYSITSPEKIRYLTPMLNAQLLGMGMGKYFNHGSIDFFFDLNNGGPAMHMHTLMVLQNLLSGCDEVINFTPPPGFSVAVAARRTDGRVLTILSKSAAARGCYELPGKVDELYDLDGAPVGFSYDKERDLSVTDRPVEWLYVIADQPKSATVAGSAAEALLENGSFELLAGDVLSNSGNALPLGWEEREIIDPEGSIVFCDEARSGKQALCFTGSGKERVYAVYRLNGELPPGNYRISGWAKSDNDSERFCLGFYDRQLGTFKAETFRPGEDYEKFSYDFTLDARSSSECIIVAGLAAGAAGSICCDDVEFTAAPLSDCSDFTPLALNLPPSAGMAMRAPAEINLDVLGAMQGEELISGVPVVFDGRAATLSKSGEWSNITGETFKLATPDLRCRELLFFVTAMYVSEGAELVGQIKITYADGLDTTVPLRNHIEIRDWFSLNPDDRPREVYSIDNPAHMEYGLFAVRWNNPRPETPIKSLTFTGCDSGILAVTAVSAGK